MESPKKFICCGRCACCNPKVFEFWFGVTSRRRRRRTHDEVILEKKIRQEAIARRKEFYARLKLEKQKKMLTRGKIFSNIKKEPMTTSMG